MINFRGWNCDLIRSGNLECLITLDVGPRVISLTDLGSENLFYVIPEDLGQIGGNEYRHYGGHRLWTTPEDLSYTYHIENTSVIKSDSWYLSAVDPRGIQKGLSVTPIENGFLVQHKLTNLGTQTIETSPWGITMLRPGGYSIFPNEPPSSSLVPVRSLSLWSYTKLNDPRLSFGDNFTSVHHQDTPSSFKIGAYVSKGWGAYITESKIFHKTFSGVPDKYPDLGCNFEVYTDSKLLETETTGTVRSLSPGDILINKEVWQVFDLPLHGLFDICEEKANLVKNLVN
jgi:hypothetical protein